MPDAPPPAGRTPPRPPLTRAAVNAYLRGGGACCPFCGGAEGVQPQGHPAYVGADMIYAVEHKIDCLACGGKWKELYRLITIEERG